MTATSSKSTKRALTTSIVAILACIAMLVGTTFAWFTDTASTNVNKIQAGTLGIEIQDDAGNAIDTLNWVAKDGRTQDAILWEPGATYNLTPFKVVNTGNLALKYKIVVTGLDGDADLLNVIKFTYTVGGVALDLNQEGYLPAEGLTGMITVSAHMDEAAGNDYMGKTLEGVKINVYATQHTSEYDSFNNTYDANATYPTADQAELSSLLSAGKVATLASDIAPTASIVANGTESTFATFDSNEKTIANTTDIWEVQPNNWALVSAQNGVNLTITGNGNFQAKANDCYAVDVQDGSTVVIKNGTFNGNIHAVYVLQGTAVIEGGFYSVQQKYPDASKADEFVLNCFDENRANGTASIVVKGGTFVNFNPADCQAEGAHTNFVADGYKVVSETHGADTWYIVVAE